MRLVMDLVCGQGVTTGFLSYICVWLCFKCVGRLYQHVFSHPYAFGYVFSVWAGCNDMFFVIHPRLVMF